ncbi:MAG: nitroreductase [Cellvibrionaceae bacterium]|jgi:nitroreductase
MNILQAIKERRAVRHYDPKFGMPQQDIDTLLEYAIQAPTSFNIQHWRFVLVQDKAQRAKIREAAWDQAQVTDASLLFVMCADTKAWDKNPERYWKDAPKEAQDVLIPMIKPFYEGKEQLQRDEALRSIGIAAQTIMLAAKAMDYDSCPMIGFDAEKVAELIQLPDDHIVGMLLVVGKATTKPEWPKPGQLPLSDVLVKDKF